MPQSSIKTTLAYMSSHSSVKERANGTQIYIEANSGAASDKKFLLFHIAS